MFRIDKVTITGADDSVNPYELVKLSQEFPFVEWGILLSMTQEGVGHRFPSRNWTTELARLVIDHSLDEQIQLSGHLCGRWCRTLALGTISFGALPILAHMKRLQLNFHAQELVVDTFPFMNALKALARAGDNGYGMSREIIFQIDGVNDRQFDVAIAHGIPAVPLFDLSHGAGVSPESWPIPLHEVLCGYAGGLGPYNLADEIERIRAVAGEQPVWIDMETKVRSADGKQFDLDRVRTCLEIAKPWVVSGSSI